jgi:dolichyl-phosphate-mannose-protein mannosyltransferase
MRVYNLFSDKSIIGVLLVLGLVTHFAWFGTPSSAVFDEVHFGKFITAYFTGEYYFDIHPPLGKLVLAGWGKLWGFQPGFSFASIGDEYPDRIYMALRFLPALAGALLPLVIYGIARRLKFRVPAAFLAGALVALDNALLVQSRLILLDSFMLLFGFGAVYAYLTWRDSSVKWWLLTAGLLGGAAMSIKWTGASFLGLIAVMECLHLWQDRYGTARRRIGPVLACLVAAPLLVYFSAFASHFALLPKSGPGDAFMSQAFQSGLQGNANASNPELQRPGVLAQFVELNAEMYRSNQRLTAEHPYSSEWYTWPFMDRAIFYWVKNTAHIYLLGNPLVWWGSTLAVVIVLANLIVTGIRKTDPVVLLLLGAWLLNFLPFIGIGRVMFLYHYLTALIWAILLLAYLVDRLKRPQRPALAIATLALIGFIWFAPLSYGLPISTEALRMRRWFSSWI